jgi:spore maturation protein CgeB
MDQSSVLTGNLDLLAITQPTLAKRLGHLNPAANLRLTHAQNGLPVLVKNGIPLHSLMDPLREADTFTHNSEVLSARREGRQPFVFGLGLGYHILSLADHFREITVYESDPAVLFTALSMFDWRSLIPNISFLTRGDPIPQRLRVWATPIIHPPSEQLNPDECRRVLGRFGSSKTSRDTAPHPWKILLYTPVAGGSLPIAYHAGHALENLGHHVIYADISHLASLVESVNRMAPDGSDRSAVWRRLREFIEEYLILLTEAEQPHLFFAMAQAPLTGELLNKIRSLGVPTALWFVEDYRFMDYWRRLAPHLDFFFHIQGADLRAELHRSGIHHHYYLPLAADPDIFKPVSDNGQLKPYRTDVSFMGAGYVNRRTVFSKLLDYDFKIWGTHWDLETPLGQRVQDHGRLIPTEETVLIYNAAAININLHSSVFNESLDSAGGFINPRTFEVAACGAFQLVDKRPPLDIHFNLESEMIAFSGIDDLRAKIDHYLARPHLRFEIAARARQRVLDEHTYGHRMHTLLGIITEALSLGDHSDKDMVVE